jgi:hypothetical protein
MSSTKTQTNSNRAVEYARNQFPATKPIGSEIPLSPGKTPPAPTDSPAPPAETSTMARFAVAPPTIAVESPADVENSLSANTQQPVAHPVGNSLSANTQQPVAHPVGNSLLASDRQPGVQTDDKLLPAGGESASLQSGGESASLQSEAEQRAYREGYLRGLNERATAELHRPDFGEEPYPEGQHGAPVTPDPFFIPDRHSVWD